jgi:hypothetical protein
LGLLHQADRFTRNIIPRHHSTIEAGLTTQEATSSSGIGKVHPHRHVITGASPGGERSDSNVSDTLHPTARQEYVIEVEWSFLSMPEVVGRTRFLSVSFGEKRVISAHDTLPREEIDDRRMLANFSAGIETRIAVEVSTKNDGASVGKPARMPDESVIRLADIVELPRRADRTGPNSNQQEFLRTSHPGGCDPLLARHWPGIERPRLPRQYAEAFVFVLPPPASFKSIFLTQTHRISRTLRNHCEIRLEPIKQGSLFGKSHPAIPYNKSHGSSTRSEFWVIKMGRQPRSGDIPWLTAHSILNWIGGDVFMVTPFTAKSRDICRNLRMAYGRRIRENGVFR